jgi:hypothetical protein
MLDLEEPKVSPIPCSSMINGQPCPGYAAYVYRSASTVRLICDGCAMESNQALTSGSRGLPARRSPIVEFSLLELIPARKLLVSEKEKAVSEAERAWDQLARSRELIALRAKERRLIDVGMLWSELIAVALGVVGWIAFGFVWGMSITFAVSISCYGLARWVVARYWIRPALADINSRTEDLS